MTWQDLIFGFPALLRFPRTRRSRRTFRQSPLRRIENLEDRRLLTVNFVFDYSLDNSGFFSSPAARASLEQAASLLESHLNDSLDAIIPSGTNTWVAQFSDPGTGSITTVNDLPIGADTLLIFVGARDLSGGTVAESAPGGWYTSSTDGDWLTLLSARGQVGAEPTATPEMSTDFGPWGGSLTFDSFGTSWYFGSSEAGLGSNQMDFLSVAQHELGHLLGFGTAESFDRYLSGSTFAGPHATAAYDGTGSPPLSGDRAHWQIGLTDGGQVAAMDPALAPGTRRLFTGLDFAVLNDIGWNSNGGTDGGGGGDGGGNGGGGNGGGGNGSGSGGSGSGGGSGSVIISAGSGLRTSESGGSVSFTAKLSVQPTSTVIVNISSSNVDEAFLSTSTLMFTTQNWNTPQTVTVTGVDDLMLDGDKTYQVITSPAISTDARFNGFNAPDITIINTDNDAAGITVTPTTGLVTTEQGGTSSFRVYLNSQPSTNVTINLNSSNTKEGTISISTLVFTPTNWMIAQTVTVTGVDDKVSDSNKTYSIVLAPAISGDKSYSGVNPADVAVTSVSIPDRDPTIVVSESEITIQTPGSPMVLDSQATVFDVDSPFASLNGAQLTISLTSNGNSADRLTIQNVGKGKNQIGIPTKGSSITYGGVTIGTRTGGTGTTPLKITFNKNATMPMVQEVVRNLQFRTTTSNKSNLARCVSMQLKMTDGTISNQANKIVRVLTGELPPVLNVGASPVNYANGSGAQLVAATASLTDPDSLTFGGGKLTVAVAAGAGAGDVLKIRRQGRGAGQIDAANDGTIRFGTTVIGSWSGGSKGKPLVITLKSTASVSAVQALIRNITFETAATNNSLATRTLQFLVTDGKGGSSGVMSKDIAVSA